MAVVNAYVDTLIDSGRQKPQNTGLVKRIACGTFEVAAADDDGSIYRLCRLPADAIITDFKLFNDAIAGATDYDLGFYNYSSGQVTGAVVSKDVLLNGISMVNARNRGAYDTDLPEAKKVYLQATMKDISAAGTGEAGYCGVASPVAGKVTKVTAVAHGAVTVANTAIAVTANAAAAGTITVAAAGSDAGVIDTLSPTSNNDVAVGELIEFTSDGGSTDTCGMTFIVEITPTNLGPIECAVANVAVGTLFKKIYELLGKTISDKKDAYDLAITANTVGTAAGTIEWLVEYAMPL